MKEKLHAAFVSVGKQGAKLLPDRVPVTFVGVGSVAELCDSIGHSGSSKVLVVTDATLVELGLVGRVTADLDAAGAGWAVYSEVTPDPTFDVVEAGHARYVAERCDAVLALGGGSPMDAAKMIAAMATNGGDLGKLEGKFKVRKAPAPLSAIPTTAGTGSEVTIAAVMSDTATHSKKFFLDPKLMPAMTALDPSFMTGLPAHITAATGMDALTHAVESYIGKAATAQTRSYSVTAVRLVFTHLRTAFSEPTNIEARKAMALASYYAGLAFTRTSVGYVHAIAHNLGAMYGTPHGLGNAIAMPYVLDYSLDAAQTQLAELGELIGVDGATERAKAEGFVAAVRSLQQALEIPNTLDSLEASDIPTLAQQACDEAFLDYPVPRWMEPADCEAVLSRMLSPALS